MKNLRLILLNGMELVDWECPKCSSLQPPSPPGTPVQQAQRPATVLKRTHTHLPATNIPAQVPAPVPSTGIPVLLSWNADGISTKKAELSNFITNNPDVKIILIQETKLMATDKTPFLPNFSAVRLDRNAKTRGGGLLTYVHQSIPFRRIQRQTVNNQTIEILDVSIKIADAWIYASNIYWPPKSKRDETPTIPFGTHHITTGDFNAHSVMWDSSLDPDERGDWIEDWLTDAHLFCISDPHQPTRIPRSGGKHSSPDTTLVGSFLLNTATWRVGPLLGSDHFPQLITLLPQSVDAPNQGNKKKLTFSLKHADWNVFAEQLDIAIADCSCTSLGARAKEFSAAILKAAKKAIPMKAAKPSKRKAVWSAEIATAVSLRNKLARDMHNNRAPFLLQCATVRELVAAEQLKRWREFASTLHLSSDQRKVYSTIRAIATRPDSRTPNEALVANGKTLTTDRTKANAFARFYSANSKLRIRKEDRVLHSEVATTINSLKYGPPQQSECSLTPQELTAAIRAASANSAPGADQVHPSMIKHLTESALIHLLAIFDDCWSQGYFPQCWKSAITVTIPKPGKCLSEMKSYRPISLLSTVGKLLEKIISTRLQSITQQILPPEQSAYRSTRSAEDVLLSLTQYVSDGFQKRKPAERTTLACVDYSAAFDRVWHLGLIRKMSHSLPGRYVRFVRSFLCNRTFRVRIASSLSRTNVQKNGTPQGSCLSPMLFILYTADLPAHIHAASNSTKVGMYADDVAVWNRSSNLAHSQSEIQKALDAITEWSDHNYMSLNPSKSEAILLTPSTHEHKHDLDLKIRGVRILTPKTITYLGVAIDHGLFFHTHAANLVASVGRRTRAMGMLSGQNWGVTAEDLARLHSSFVLPKLRYCLPAFGAHLSPASITKINTAILKGARITTGLLYGTPNDAIWIESRGIAFNTEIKRACLISHEKSLRMDDTNPRAIAATEASSIRLPNKKSSRAMSQELLDQMDLPTERLPLVELVPPWMEHNIKCKASLPTATKKTDANIRTVAELAIRSHLPVDICIYTDGSAEAGSANGGSAAVFTKGDPSSPIRLKVLKEPAGAACSSYVCELLAIKMALQECAKSFSNSSILIISDSQSAISAIQSSSFATHPYIAEIGRIASSLPVVSAIYCPSHVGVIGNEWADEEARAAAAMDQYTTAIDFPSARCFIKQQITNPAPNHQLTRDVFSLGLVTRNLLSDETCRREMRKIRSGHSIRLAAFRHRLDDSISESCRFCHIEPETITHLLCCKSLSSQLRNSFGTRRPPLSILATDERSAHTYLTDIGVFDASAAPT
jgi:ribonuclease HI